MPTPAAGGWSGRWEADHRRIDDGLISLDEANKLLVSMGFAPKGK